MKSFHKNLLDEIIEREPIEDGLRFYGLKRAKEKLFKKIIRDLEKGLKLRMWNISQVMMDLNDLDTKLIKYGIYDGYNEWSTKDRWFAA